MSHTSEERTILGPASKVTLGIIFAIVGLVGASVGAFATLNQKVASLEERITRQGQLLVEDSTRRDDENSRIVRLETQYTQIIESLKEIKTAVGVRSK